MYPYNTAYESSAELDAMRVHDMDFFDLPENPYVYVQGIAHCANDREKPGAAPRERHRRDTGLSPRFLRPCSGQSRLAACVMRPA